MKEKSWLIKLPLILFFCGTFWVAHLGEKGALHSPFFREKVYPSLRVLSGNLTNLKFRLRGAQPPKNKVIVVEISDRAIETLGRWPWHRDLLADSLIRAFSNPIRAAGLDIVFSEPDTRVSDELRGLLSKHRLQSEIPKLETDPLLENAIRTYRKNLVLGWAAEASCQPLYSTPNECPVLDPELLALYPKGFEKFSIAHFQKPSGFSADQTALISQLNVIANLESFQNASLYAGSLASQPDPDGYVRRMSLVSFVKGLPYPSLALELARVGLGEELSLTLNEKNRVQSLSFSHSGQVIPVTELGVLNINFRGPMRTFPYLDVLELLSDQPEITLVMNAQSAFPFDCPGCKTTDEPGFKIVKGPREILLKDATLLFGLSAVGAFDMRAFPFDSNVPGVEGHANIVDNLLSGDALIPNAMNSHWLWLLLLMSVGAAVFAYFTHKVDSIPALAVFLCTLAGFAWVDQKILFEKMLRDWNTSLLYLEFGLLFFFTFAVKYVLEEKNKKFIKGAFSKYVAPAIVDSILKDPSKLTVGGEKRELSILFSDIRGFTTFSEKMDAKALSGFLNDYLGMMTELIFENHGTLDKYIGDAVMAFWGAPVEQPKHALNACKTAIAMMAKLRAEQARFLSQYGVVVEIGIGINSGQVSVGNMGSDRIFEYTVIGDHVNLASRTEGLTKTYGVAILTTRFTLDCIQQSGDSLPPHRVLDRAKVKGKKNAVELIQILERDFAPQGLAAFEEGRQLYIQRQWDAALSQFQKAATLLRSVDGEQEDGPCQLFIERCEKFRQTPPDSDWDGSWEMTSK